MLTEGGFYTRQELTKAVQLAKTMAKRKSILFSIQRILILPQGVLIFSRTQQTVPTQFCPLCRTLIFHGLCQLHCFGNLLPGIKVRKKKKPKYVEDILEFDLSQQQEQGRPQDKAKPRASNNPAMEYCDQILKAAKGLEETKKDYKIVTDYLTDIQIIENLPEQEISKIQGVAQKPDIVQFIRILHMVFLTRIVHSIGNIHILKRNLIQKSGGTVDICPAR